MICCRCALPIPETADCMRLAGQPPEGRTGPRLLEMIICRECCALLAMWLAEPITAELTPTHP